MIVVVMGRWGDGEDEEDEGDGEDGEDEEDEGDGEARALNPFASVSCFLSHNR